MADQHQREIEAFGSNDDFWIFGYGSLIWKPPPHYDQRLPGYIEGYVRRFWQVHHRGTPEAPGRVVTLIEKKHWETLGEDEHPAAPRVWGAAYHIPAAHVASVRAYLDLREINGYSIQFTPFHPALSRAEVTSPPLLEPAESEAGPSLSRGIKATSTVSVTQEAGSIRCLVYIGLPENPQFLGRQEVGALAARILESKGPSGENKEYLYNLETALLGLSKDSGDAHISDLAKRCKALEAEARLET
ncbi:ChaC-like protein [Stemphylium lycopersici]|uniref:glutathione-specific gamma-glutamylcyclotransferase n=1 Tax=Stemphylium lycopersici TaxID=183478 RepID=A0A364MV15_STELY|nr:ChaC-like protein [Stemphylium lycopersici]RAR04169.1 ChaC-like protein [Stemphylium lycopersici]